jgi:hypothetical protein
LNRLAVFAGSFDLQAGEAVISTDGIDPAMTSKPTSQPSPPSDGRTEGDVPMIALAATCPCERVRDLRGLI